MALLGALALTTLLANGASRLRTSALAFLGTSLVSAFIAAGATTPTQAAVLASAGMAAAGILFVAARDGAYGEDPGWRLWAATLIAAVAAPAALSSFGTAPGPLPAPTLFEVDTENVILQVAAFWLLSSGAAILVTARRAVRSSLGALLMVTGAQLLVRLVPGPQLAVTLALAWLEVAIALVGAFLIVNERAVRE